MTGQRVEQVDTGESIAEALADSEPTWVTLPGPLEESPDQLRAALDDFDAGKRAAALAAREWIRTQAIDSYQTSRTRLLIAEHRIASLASTRWPQHRLNSASAIAAAPASIRCACPPPS